MKRRKFIETGAFITGGLFLTRCSASSVLTSNKNRVKGKVTSGGKGLENVVVSDGYSVLQTNKRGNFEFEVNPLATTIFISTPSGYEFIHSNFVSRHYRLLSGLDISKEINFDLRPLAQNDTDHSFIIWADPQVKNDNDVQKMMRNSVPDVQKFVRSASPGTLIHGITVGDIVWDNLPLYSEYDKAVKDMGIPFFQCIGNHDMDYNQGGDRESDDTFEKTYGPTTYSFNRGQVHYVVMDDVRYLGKEREYDGYFQDYYLAWLKKDLSFVPADHLIILCTHIPVHDGVKNNTALYEIIKGRKVHIMSGHTHYNENVMKEGFYEHNHGTVCGAWWTGPICGDGTPNGYGIYTVKGNELQWHYQSTGKAADHQMKIFLKEYNATEQYLIVNIWNYDDAWQNSFMVDGVAKGSLEKYKGFDPGAYKNLLGPDLPAKRGFAEPRITDHLFQAIIPAGAKEITVTATDRFGKKYMKIYKV